MLDAPKYLPDVHMVMSKLILTQLRQHVWQSAFRKNCQTELYLDLELTGEAEHLRSVEKENEPFAGKFMDAIRRIYLPLLEGDNPKIFIPPIAWNNLLDTAWKWIRHHIGFRIEQDINASPDGLISHGERSRSVESGCSPEERTISSKSFRNLFASNGS